MDVFFVCPRCGNSSPQFIGIKNKKLYCRKCISFKGEMAPVEEKKPKTVGLSLAYSLSFEQRTLSEKVLSNFKQGIDTLIYAVCGSGKTEISYAVLGYAMSRGMRVGFALPRRDVVIELFYRLKDAFPGNTIAAVYGGNTSSLTADCLILTTHQLYRYPSYFDLLVMDEIDAFPFKGNDVLISLYRKSLRGHCVMMSATPSKAVVADFRKPGREMVTLHTRFHRKPIPVPRNVLLLGMAKLPFLVHKLRQFEKEKKPCLVFVPSVALSKSLFDKLRLFVPKGNYVSSQRQGRPEIIKSFKEGTYQYLVTTAVLERGVTVRNCQVIVFNADSSIYDAAALIQIAGRAGRKMDAPTGEVIFLADEESEAMKNAIAEINYCNTFLQAMRKED